MSELTLNGLHEDGEHLVLKSQDGAEFTLAIDAALRAAVRGDRSRMEHHRAGAVSKLSPREIQAKIRAGIDLETIAEAAGTSIENIERYEGPVVAEQDHIVRLAQQAHLGRITDSPVLGELVVDRLAQRGIATSNLEWTAWRLAGEPWTVRVRYTEKDESIDATWSYDTSSRQVQALDDAAKSLSETQLLDSGGSNPRRPRPLVPTSPVTPEVFNVEEALDAAEAGEERIDTTQLPAVLDELSARRGVRQTIQPDLDSEPEDLFDGFGPQELAERDNEKANERRPVLRSITTPEPPPEAPVRVSSPETSPAASPETSDEELPAPLARSRSARKGRSQVPSWDEIVFGAKQDED